MILLLQPKRDVHGEEVKSRLEQLGADFLDVDLGLFPEDLSISCLISDTDQVAYLRVKGER